MALLGNANVFTKLPIKFMGGSTTSLEVQIRYNFNKTGALRNREFQDGTTATYKVTALPSGYNAGYTWMMPEVSGDMGAGNGQIAGLSTIYNANVASGQYIAAPSLSGSGAVSNAADNATGNLNGPLSGVGAVSNATSFLTAAISAALTGAGDATSANAALSAYVQAALSGTGAVTNASAVGAILAVASFAGSGSISNANTALAAGISAGLTGSGTVSAVVNAIWSMVGALSGAGSVSNASETALGWQVANLSGTGSVSNALPFAPGKIGADIKSYTDLTSQGAADAVWGQILEAGYSAEDLMRLLTAVLAGKVSGAAGTTVTFRDINDTVNRIVATVDTAGDRSALTYNVN